MSAQMTQTPLATATAYTVLPAVDAKRAFAFYHDTLGLETQWLPDAEGYFFVHPAHGGDVLVFQRPATKAEHTVLGFDVDDLDAAISALRERGVVFEEYDMPGLKTVNGVASMGNTRSAWFKDTEGNIIGLNEMG